jgi:hypothetical protein
MNNFYNPPYHPRPILYIISDNEEFTGHKLYQWSSTTTLVLITIRVKTKSSRFVWTSWKTCARRKVQLHSFLLWTLDGDEWSVSWPGRCNPKENVPRTHWIGGWVGFRASLAKRLSQHNYLISHDRHTLFIFYTRNTSISTKDIYPLVTNYYIQFQDDIWSCYSVSSYLKIRQKFIIWIVDNGVASNVITKDTHTHTHTHTHMIIRTHGHAGVNIKSLYFLLKWTLTSK